MKENPCFVMKKKVDNDSDHCIVVDFGIVDDCFEMMMVLMIMMFMVTMMMIIPATVILRAPARCPNC